MEKEKKKKGGEVELIDGGNLNRDEHSRCAVSYMENLFSSLICPLFFCLQYNHFVNGNCIVPIL